MAGVITTGALCVAFYQGNHFSLQNAEYRPSMHPNLYQGDGCCSQAGLQIREPGARYHRL
jgi:hypothetical protein